MVQRLRPYDRNSSVLWYYLVSRTNEGNVARESHSSGLTPVPLTEHASPAQVSHPVLF